MKRSHRPLPLRTTPASALLRLDPVARFLRAYDPVKVSRADWDGEVGQFVRDQVLRLNISVEQAEDSTRYLLGLALWCVKEHIPLDIESVLDPDTVERYCLQAAPGRTPSSIARVRTELRRLGRSLTRRAPWEPPPEPYARTKRLASYSVAELHAVERDIRRQATPARCRAARAAAAMGLGLGLDGRWIAKIRGTDVWVSDGHVEVEIPEPMPRLVVARVQYESELIELAAEAEDGPLLGFKVGSKNAASHFARQIVIDQGRVPFSPARLRSTWIVAQLEAGTQLPVLLKAAGLRAVESLDDLLPYVRPSSDADARNQLGRA